mgnify:CR=1 FL=1
MKPQEGIATSYTEKSCAENAIYNSIKQVLLFPAALLLLTAFASTAYSQTVMYVDSAATAGGDGSSWFGAYTSLQDALAEARNNPGTEYEIWIAEGTYYPDEGAGIPDNKEDTSFVITGAMDGLGLYGGFDGTETSRSQRDPHANETILSGDIQQDDKAYAPNVDSDGDPYSPSQIDHMQGGNSNHLFFLDGSTGGNITPNTVIDGVTITSGKAGNTDFQQEPKDWGGAVFCEGSGSGNKCSPTFKNVVFRANAAMGYYGRGGALYLDGDQGESSPRFYDVTFVHNASQSSGGALYNKGYQGESSPIFINTTFHNNYSNYSGGAIYNQGAGGGLSKPYIVNSVFYKNIADTVYANGGAIGGNAYNGETGAVIHNSTFLNNRSKGEGGAIGNDGNNGTASIEIKNSIVWGNTAAKNGDQIYNNASTLDVGYTQIQGGLAGISENSGSATNDLGGNISRAAYFVDTTNIAGDDHIYGTADDGLRPVMMSSAADAGNNIMLPTDTLDIDSDGITDEKVPYSITGAARIHNNRVNMGAYEVVKDLARTLYVDSSATSGDADGLSWANADTTLQDALAKVNGNDQIWIAEGTYYPDEGAGIPDNKEDTSFVITGAMDGLGIYGGFDGTETSRSQRDPGANETILSGDIQQDDQPFEPETDSDGDSNTPSQTDHIVGANSYHVLYLDASASNNITTDTRIDGLTITSGQAGDGDSYGEIVDRGAGLYCFGENSGNNCSPRLHNLVLKGNTHQGDYFGSGSAYFNGGYEGKSSPIITDSKFYANYAPDSGGGLVVMADGNGTSKMQIRNTVFTGNRASTGAAIHNTSYTDGASNIRIINSLFYNNFASDKAGAINSYGSIGTNQPQIVNSLFFKNEAVNTGGAVRDYYSNSRIINSIFHSNSASSGSAIYSDSYEKDTTRIRYSLIDTADGSVGSGNDAKIVYQGGIVGESPKFVDANNPFGADGFYGTGDDGLRQYAISPGWNAGTPDTTGLALTAKDVKGEDRVQKGRIDLGPYEGGLDRELTLHVDGDATGEADGFSWADADTTLQDALTKATGNDQIWIAEGTYYPDEGAGIPDNKEDTSFVISSAQNGLQIYGGFQGAESAKAERQPKVHPTILSGDIEQNDDPFAPATDSDNDSDTFTQTDHLKGDNSFHVVWMRPDSGRTIDRSTLLAGVTIEAGQADKGWAAPTANGGGLYCGNYYGSHYECSPRLKNLVLKGNTALDGGGIYVDNAVNVTASPLIQNTYFIGNSTNFRAGALFINENQGLSKTTVRNSVFYLNRSLDLGGAIYLRGTNSENRIRVINSTFVKNESSSGGCIYHKGDKVGLEYSSFFNLAFAANKATYEGDALLVKESTVTLEHSRLDTSSVVESTDGTINFKDTVSGAAGFVDTTNVAGPDGVYGTSDDGLRLRPYSAAIDAGTPDTTGLALPATDITGARRVKGTIDAGAYESGLNLTLNGDEGWRMMSAPLAGQSYNNLLDTLWIQSVTGGDTDQGSANLFTWNESSTSFATPGGLSEQPGSGKGFLTYVFSDQDYDGEPEGFPKTLSLTGSEPSSPAAIDVTSTDADNSGTFNGSEGWNMLGNPYATPISVDGIISAAESVNDQVNTTLYVWDSGNNSYRLLPEGGNHTIAPWQGFWLRYLATGVDGSFNLSRSDVKAGDAMFYKPRRNQGKQEGELVLNLQAGKQLRSTYKVILDERSSKGLDRHDAFSPQPISARYVRLFSRTEGNSLAHNRIPPKVEDTVEVPLYLQSSTANENSLNHVNLQWNAEALPESWNLVLHDHLTGKRINLRDRDAYQFELNEDKKESAQKNKPVQQLQIPEVTADSTGTAQETENRFTLIIGPGVALANAGHNSLPNKVKLHHNYPNPFNPATTIRYSVPEQSRVELTVYNSVGRRIKTLVRGTKNPGRYRAQFNGSQLASGIYFYRLKVADQVKTRKMMLIK